MAKKPGGSVQRVKDALEARGLVNEVKAAELIAITGGQVASIAAEG